MSTFKWMGGARIGKVKKTKVQAAADAQRSFFASRQLTPAFSTRQGKGSLTPGKSLLQCSR